jgi:starvation-inducible outer membrane lipoprotein
MRALISLCLACACAAAQAQPQEQSQDRPDPRQNQKIQRIHVEDDGARIDELRVGGQTQSITVQPKAAVPEYEFQSSDLSRSRPADNRDGLSSPASQRVWNLFKF